MDKQTKKQPPENPSSIGSTEGPTKHKGSRIIKVTGSTPQEGTYALTTTAGVQIDQGHTTKLARPAAYTVPPLKQTILLIQPKIVESPKKEFQTSVKTKPRSSDADNIPDTIASDEFSKNTNTTDNDNSRATRVGTRTRTNRSMTGQWSETTQTRLESSTKKLKPYMKQLTDQFEQSTDQQKPDVSYSADVKPEDVRVHALTHSTEGQLSVHTEDDEVSISKQGESPLKKERADPHYTVGHQGDKREHQKSENKYRQFSVLTARDKSITPNQDKPKGTGAHMDNRDESPDDQNLERQHSGHISTREVIAPKKDKPKYTGENTDDMDESPDAHDIKNQSSGHTTTRNDKDMNPKQAKAADTCFPMRDRMSKQQQERNQDSSEPLEDSVKQAEDKPKYTGAHTDDMDESPDAHDIKNQSSGHTTTRNDKDMNPKQAKAADTCFPMRDRMSKQQQERNQDSSEPLEDSVKQAEDKPKYTGAHTDDMDESPDAHDIKNQSSGHTTTRNDKDMNPKQAKAADTCFPMRDRMSKQQQERNQDSSEPLEDSVKQAEDKPKYTGAHTDDMDESPDAHDIKNQSSEHTTTRNDKDMNPKQAKAADTCFSMRDRMSKQQQERNQDSSEPLEDSVKQAEDICAPMREEMIRQQQKRKPDSTESLKCSVKHTEDPTGETSVLENTTSDMNANIDKGGREVEGYAEYIDGDDIGTHAIINHVIGLNNDSIESEIADAINDTKVRDENHDVKTDSSYELVNEDPEDNIGLTKEESGAASINPPIKYVSHGAVVKPEDVRAHAITHSTEGQHNVHREETEVSISKQGASPLKRERDKPHHTVGHPGDKREHPKSEDKDRQSSVLTARDKYITPNQDKPKGTGAHMDNRDESPDDQNLERQHSGHTRTREVTTPKQDKPEGMSAQPDDMDKCPDAHDKERQYSGYTSTRDNKNINTKQATDVCAPMREGINKQQHQRNPDSTEPLKRSVKQTEEQANVSVEVKLSDAIDDTTIEEDHAKIVNANDKDKRQPNEVVDLKGDKDKIVDTNLRESITEGDWVYYTEGENKAKEKEKADEVEGVSDDSCEKISDEEDKYPQNNGEISIQLPVASMVQTNIQKVGNQPEVKSNLITEQAKLKLVGLRWVLAVGKRNIVLPSDIKNARVDGEFLVTDGNVIYEIHNNKGAIVLKPIENAKIQTSNDTNTAEQQRKSSEEHLSVSDPPKENIPKEKHIASNAPGIGSKEKNLVKPKTRESIQSKKDTLLANVEMKDENENTEDRDVSTMALDDVMNGITNLSLQEENYDVECSNNELSMSPTATKRTIEKQPVKASDQDSTVLKISQYKSNVTQAPFSVSARENASAKLMSHKARNKSQSFDETAEVGENDMKQFEKSRSGEQSDKKPSLQPEFNNYEKEKESDQASSATPAVPPRHKHGKPITSGQDQMTPSNEQTVKYAGASSGPNRGPSGPGKPITSGQDQMTPSNEQTVKYEGASSGPNRGASGPASMGGEVIEKKLKCQISYKDNKECVSLETDLETYMKLKYNLNNPKWLCQKQKNLNDQYPGMRIGYERHMDVVIINLDVNKPLGIQPAIVDDVVKALLQTTDHLFVNSVAIGGIDKIQVIEVINQHHLVKDRDLYVECDIDLDYLYYVCPYNVKTLVYVLLQITTKQLLGPKKNIIFDMVYKEIFKKTNMLDKIKSENRPLQVSLHDENDDKFVCVLRGCNEDVTWAENLINTEIIQRYGFACFSIKDIKHRKEFETSELSDLVEETLQHKRDSNIEYHFNSNGTISICGINQGNTDMYVYIIRRMLENKTIPIVNKDISRAQLENYIEEVQSTVHTRIIITILGEDPYMVKLVGPKDSIELVKTRLLRKTNPKKDMATKFKVIESENKKQKQENKGSELTCQKKTIWIKDYDVFTHICAKEDLLKLAEMHGIQPDKLEEKETKSSQGFCVTGGSHRYEATKEYFSQYTCAYIAFTFKDIVKIPDVLHQVERTHNVTLKEFSEPSEIECATSASAKAFPGAGEVAGMEKDRTKIYFPSGHSVMVVHDDAVNCCKDVSVDIYDAETRTLSQVKRQYIAVSVVKGKLDEIKADIIVNTTNHNLQLDCGAVSNALLRRAGKELQLECRRNHPGNIMSGEIVVTKGYQLRCDLVFHSSLDIYSGTAENIKNLVVDCLKKAASMQCRSIAFPAIGTGNLTYPKQKVAAAMFEGVHKFDYLYSGSSVKQVDFVIYPGHKEAVTVFGEYQIKYNKQKGDEKSVTIKIIGKTREIRCAKEALQCYTATRNYNSGPDALKYVSDLKPRETSPKQPIRATITTKSILTPLDPPPIPARQKKSHALAAFFPAIVEEDTSVEEISNTTDLPKYPWSIEGLIPLKPEIKKSYVTKNIQFEESKIGARSFEKLSMKEEYKQINTESLLQPVATKSASLIKPREFPRPVTMLPKSTSKLLNPPSKPKTVPARQGIDNILKEFHVSSANRRAALQEDWTTENQADTSDIPTPLWSKGLMHHKPEIKKPVTTKSVSLIKPREFPRPVTMLPKSTSKLLNPPSTPITVPARQGIDNILKEFHVSSPKRRAALQEDWTTENQADTSDIPTPLWSKGLMQHKLEKKKEPKVQLITASSESTDSTQTVDITDHAATSDNPYGIETIFVKKMEASSKGDKITHSSNMIGSITTKPHAQDAFVSSEEEEDIQPDMFDIIIRCKKRRGGYSTIVLKAQNTEDALKWRYIFSRNRHHMVKHKIECVCNSVKLRLDRNAVDIKCENVKPSVIEEIITHESVELRVKEFRIDMVKSKKVEEVLTSNSPDFANKTVTLFTESSVCYLVSPAHVFEANIENFQRTLDLLTTLI